MNFEIAAQLSPVEPDGSDAPLGEISAHRVRCYSCHISVDNAEAFAAEMRGKSGNIRSRAMDVEKTVSGQDTAFMAGADYTINGGRVLCPRFAEIHF